MTVYRQVSRHNRNERNFGAMTDGWKPPAPGALDDAAWSEHLLARAIDAGASDDRLHGYSVLDDVSHHYPFSDLIYLALVGELPDPRRSSLFALALFSFATPGEGAADGPAPLCHCDTRFLMYCCVAAHPQHRPGRYH